MLLLIPFGFKLNHCIKVLTKFPLKRMKITKSANVKKVNGDQLSRRTWSIWTQKLSKEAWNHELIDFARIHVIATEFLFEDHNECLRLSIFFKNSITDTSRAMPNTAYTSNAFIDSASSRIVAPSINFFMNHENSLVTT